MISNATKFKIALAILITSSTLAGCTLTELTRQDPEVVYKTRTVDTACQWTKIITVSRDDRMTDETWNQLLAHNKEWVRRCGTKK